jgi:2-dehydropantoate 2-reductase
MDIGIVGTGNIGTVYGWALAEAGHRVTHLVRPGGRRAAEARLDVLDERSGREVRRLERYAWQVAEELPASTELVLVATPATRVRAAIEALAPSHPDTTFVTWAMEWDPVPLEDLVPAERLVIGYPDSGGTRDDAAGSYVLSLGATPHLGVRAGTTTAQRLEAVDALLRSAGFSPERHDPFEPWLWVHAALTVPYWVALDHVRDIERFVRDRALLRSAFRASHEVLRLVAARGIDLDAYDEVAMNRMPAWLFPFAFRMLYRTNEGMRRAASHAVDGIGEGFDLASRVLRTADVLGVPMPELRRLAEDGLRERAGSGLTAVPITRSLS